MLAKANSPPAKLWQSEHVEGMKVWTSSQVTDFSAGEVVWLGIVESRLIWIMSPLLGVLFEVLFAFACCSILLLYCRRVLSLRLLFWMLDWVTDWVCGGVASWVACWATCWVAGLVDLKLACSVAIASFQKDRKNASCASSSAGVIRALSSAVWARSKAMVVSIGLAKGSMWTMSKGTRWPRVYWRADLGWLSY